MDRVLNAVATHKCVGCGNCRSVCGVDAVKFAVRKGFRYPEIDAEACVGCGKCDKACPVNGESAELSSPISFYAAYANQAAMHPGSTSGGICTVASETMILNAGVVYSARFTENWNVEYARADNCEALGAHIGSKYMQADFNGVQAQIADDLKAEKYVLLIGTPCFISAVKKYLCVSKIDCQKLVTVDFLCHGVPSAEIGRTFIQSLEEQAGRKLELYNFRSKGFGWGKLSRSMKFEGKKEKTIRADFCPLHTWFGQHLSLRESCFACDYRRVDRPSDITVADFWKIEKYYPELPFQQGVSAVQINTAQGKDFFHDLLRSGKIISQPVSKESIWEHRRTATKNFEKPERYDAFWNEWETNGLQGIERMTPAQSAVGLIKAKLRSMIR